MAYVVNFWTFSKKRNSTEQPVDNYKLFSLQCELMDSSGILNPTLKINSASIPNNVNIKFVNYAEIVDFGRYYYITNVRYDRGLWFLEMQVDVLASNKDFIASLTTYVLRSAINYDRTIMDNTYPIKTGAYFNATTQNSNPFATTFSSGYFVVGIINGDSSSYGAVSYYVFTSSEFRSFASYIIGHVNMFSATEISDQLLKLLFNPFQYIVSCTWLPITPPMGSVISSIPLGWWNVTASCHRLGSNVRASGTVTITIPVHPQATDRAYLKSEPYSQYYLDFPPFGAVSIPANFLVNASYVDFAWSCDCITGEGKLQMGANSAQPFNIMHGQIGVPIQLAQMTPDITSAVQQLVPTTGNATADSFLTTLANIGSALIQSNLPMQTTGSTGGFMAGYYPIRLTGIFYEVANEELYEFGAPCCKTLTLGDLSGFIQCAHGEFTGICTLTEREEVNSFLTSGFFME